MSNSGEIPSAKLQFQWAGETLEFECFDNCLSRIACEAILSGATYRAIPFVRDVKVVMDIGANVGAASVFFSLSYPDATVFAFEPGSRQYRLLKVNTDARPNIQAHNFGLYSSNLEVPLYRGTYDSGCRRSTRARARGMTANP